jgi:hypothetical protein
MTQDSTNPEYWAEHQSTQSLFVHRLFTYMNSATGQIYRTYANQLKVSFSSQAAWYSYLPIISWFGTGIQDHSENNPNDIVSYNFQTLPYASSSETLSNTNIAFGFVTISITQSQMIESTVYSVPTFMTILSTFGG